MPSLNGTTGSTPPHTCDILVVGGGPAGLMAARAAAQAGADTVVIERQNEIGYPVHTSGGSWVSDMQDFGVPEHLFHPVDACTFITPGAEATAQLPLNVACVLDVRGVYQHLAERAVHEGARVLVRHSADGVLFDSEAVAGVGVKDHTGRRSEIRAKVTIDASGHSRRVAVRAGLGEGFHRHAFGAEYDLYAPHYPQNHTYFLMGNTFAPTGYGWVFPRGQGRVRVGVGVIQPDTKVDARHYLDVVMRLPQFVDSLRGASPIEYHTGLFPVAPPLKAFSRAGLLAAGDVSAHGSSLLGEGIRFAMYSGQLAGEVAGEAISGQDVSAKFLAAYDKRWRARFGKTMDIAYFLGDKMMGFTDEQWDRRIPLIEKMTPEQAIALLRCDFDAKLFRSIMVRAPRLAARGGKRLLQMALDKF